MKNILKIINFVIIIIVFFIVIVILRNKLDHNYTIQFEKSKLNEYLKKFKSNADSIEITRIIDNTIYGVFNDTTKNDDLFLTLGFFTYDVINDRFNYYENSDNNRIVDFHIKDNNIYTITVDYYKNYFNWKVNLNFKNTLLKGIILDFFSYPTLMINDEKIYLAYIDNSINESQIIQTFCLSSISENNIINLNSLKSTIGNTEDYFVTDISRVALINRNIIYKYQNQNSQVLVKYNLDNNSEENIYETTNEYLVYSYLLYDDYLYYQLVYNTRNQNSQINIISDDNNNSKETDKISTFENVLDGNILLRNNDNNWKYYNVKENKLYNVNTNINEFMPKYYILNKNKIVAINFNSEVFIGEFVDER